MMIHNVSMERLSLLAGNLATCLTSGMSMHASVRLSARSWPGSLGQGIDSAVCRAKAGAELSEALGALDRRLPPFVIPVIRCGEQSGRLVETLQYLQRHCHMLAGPSRAARNIWLYPLIVILFGALVRIVAFFAFAPLWIATWYFIRTVVRYGLTAAAIAWMLVTPRGKLLVDRVKLTVPFCRDIERDLGLNRFFHAFNLLYSTGDLRVETMLRLAIDTVSNAWIRDDLRRAITVIESGGSVAEAFAAPKRIGHDQKLLVATGEEAGKLEEAFDQLARETADSAVARLGMVQQVSLRLIAFAVTASIVGTTYGLTVAFR